MSKVFWTTLNERHGASYEESFNTILDVVGYTARFPNYYRMVGKYAPPAHARNRACQTFMRTSDPDPNDTLVMLDVDHYYQADIVHRLASHDEGVVGALATSRGDMPFLCFFRRDPADGIMYNMSDWEDGEYVEGTIIGTGAIAIKRWVLEKLAHCAPSWFRYTYNGYDQEATEDMYFGYECEKADIPHYCDTSLWIPHCTVAYTTPDDWKAYAKDHPEVRNRVSPALANGHEQKIEVVQGEDKWEKLPGIIKQTL